MRAAIGLRAPTGRGRLAVPVALALSFVLLALAASQPVIASSQRTTVSRNADVFIVLDTSRSMLAARSAQAPSRFERARSIARTLLRDLPPAPIGLASLTDRVLPHAFPTTSRRDLELTLREAMGVERPPPFSRRTGGPLRRASSFAALEDLGDARYFAPAPRRRIAVVLTDGESRPFDPAPLRRAFRQGRVDVVFVRIWDARERVWSGGVPAPDYRPDPASGPLLAQLAAAVGAESFAEDEVDALVAAIRAKIGSGRIDEVSAETDERQLAPLAAGAALVPLALVLWRRNLR